MGATRLRTINVEEVEGHADLLELLRGEELLDGVRVPDPESEQMGLLIFQEYF